MPIEIKELVIRTTIEEVKKQTEQLAPAPVNIDEKQLVKDCVEKVLEELERRGQR